MAIPELERALSVGSRDGTLETGTPVSEELIDEVERHLGLSFPPSYRELVRRVGLCAVGSREFYGVTQSGLTARAVPSAVFATLSERSVGRLPEGLVLIEDSSGEEQYVLDTRSVAAGEEAPVCVWMPAFHDAPDLPHVAPDFGSYLLDAVKAVST